MRFVASLVRAEDEMNRGNRAVNILLFLVFIVFTSGITLPSADAQIEFLFSDTTAQVGTTAGSQRNSGTTETVAPGSLRNVAFAEVKQDQQGNGAGSASSEIRVDTAGQPTEMFVFLQVTASVLPEFNSATFSEAKVTYFFTNPTRVEVQRRIRQGDTRFFIDNVQRQLTGTVTRFDIPIGTHSFEIEVVPGTEVVNPNFSLDISALDAPGVSPSPTPIPTPTPTPTASNPSTGIVVGINSILSSTSQLSPTLNRNNKTDQSRLLTLIRQLNATLTADIKGLLPSLSKTKRTRVQNASQSVSKAIAALRAAGSNAKSRRDAKGKLAAALRSLIRAISN
jgi:hypothetical protein